MAGQWIERLTGSFDDKKRWRKYKARKEQLPADYRTVIDALERYFTYAGSIVKGDVLLQMLEDLVDLIERAALDRTPIRGLLGEDPAEFAEAFLRNYADGQWIAKERRRLIEAIRDAAEPAETA